DSRQNSDGQGNQQGNKVQLEGNGNLGGQHLPHGNTGLNRHRGPPIPVEQNILQKIAVLHQKRVVEVILILQDLDHVSGQHLVAVIDGTGHQADDQEGNRQNNEQGDQQGQHALGNIFDHSIPPFSA